MQQPAATEFHRERIHTHSGSLGIVSGGLQDAPLILFLHGYPDSSRVWLETMQAFASTHRVATFDMRGVGNSTPDRRGSAYRIDAVLEDIDAVLDHLVGAHGQAHLVGHDWGSTLGWSYVAHPQFTQRVLSWTSMSGPHLGIWVRWGKSNLRSLNPRQISSVLGQLGRSAYALFLLAFPISDLFWRIFHLHAWQRILRFAGVPANDPMLQEDAAQVLSMSIKPMWLYRCNLLRPPPAPEHNSITTPTLVITPTGDNFVSPASFNNLGDYVVNLQISEIEGSHWAQRSHPEAFRSALRQFIQA